MTVNQYFNHWNLLKSVERLLCLTFLTTSFFHHGKMHYQMVFSYTCQCLFLPTLKFDSYIKGKDSQQEASFSQ